MLEAFDISCGLAVSCLHFATGLWEINMGVANMESERKMSVQIMEPGTPTRFPAANDVLDAIYTV